MAVWEMNLGQGLAQGHQIGSPQHSLRQEIRAIVRKRIDGALYHCAQPVGGDAFGERVYRHEPAGAELVSVQRLELRVADDRDVAVVVDFAAEGIGVTGVQLALDERVEPCHLHLAGAVADDGRDHPAILSDEPALDIPHRTDDGHFLAPFKPIDCAELAEVVVTVRQQVEQVAHGQHVELRQLLGVTGSDGRQTGHRRIQAQAGSRRAEGWGRLLMAPQRLVAVALRAETGRPAKTAPAAAAPPPRVSKAPAEATPVRERLGSQTPVGIRPGLW